MMNTLLEDVSGVDAGPTPVTVQWLPQQQVVFGDAVGWSVWSHILAASALNQAVQSRTNRSTSAHSCSSRPAV